VFPQSPETRLQLQRSDDINVTLNGLWHQNPRCSHVNLGFYLPCRFKRQPSNLNYTDEANYIRFETLKIGAPNKCRKTRVQQVPCSASTMFSKNGVQLVPCSVSTTFNKCHVQQVPCSASTVFSKYHVQQVPCSVSTVISKYYVQQVRCSNAFITYRVQTYNNNQH
jgi:hypothetical protein